jgi:hypothetical protein
VIEPFLLQVDWYLCHQPDYYRLVSDLLLQRILIDFAFLTFPQFLFPWRWYQLV